MNAYETHLLNFARSLEAVEKAAGIRPSTQSLDIADKLVNGDSKPSIAFAVSALRDVIYMLEDATENDGSFADVSKDVLNFKDTIVARIRAQISSITESRVQSYVSGTN